MPAKQITTLRNCEENESREDMLTFCHFINGAWIGHQQQVPFLNTNRYATFLKKAVIRFNLNCFVHLHISPRLSATVDV